MNTKEQTHGGAMNRFPTGFHYPSRLSGALAAVLLFLLWFAFPTTQAASFPCEKATTAVERMICEDTELSKLDDQLAESYEFLLGKSHDRGLLQIRQGEWLTRVRNSCKDVACLKRAYVERLNGVEGDASVLPRPGKYVLIKGRGIEVCEAYGGNLNSFGLQMSPMVCERRINLHLTDFKKPKWSQPSQDQVRALVFEDARLTSRMLGLPELKNEIEIVTRGVRDAHTPGWAAKRQIARVDIDNDGVTNIVLKQEDGGCGTSRVFSVNIAVLSEDGKTYDLEKSKYINAEFSRRAAILNKDTNPDRLRTAGLSVDELKGSMLYDIFLYKGVAHFDHWEKGNDYPDPRSGRLHVFLHKGGMTQLVCTYKFQR